MAANPIFDLDPERIAESSRKAGLDDASDLDLLGLSAEVIAVPRRDVTSFVLHAPLELMARYRLLAPLSQPDKTLARLQLLKSAATYARLPDPIATPPTHSDRTAASLAADLGDAVERGAADEAFGLAAAMAARMDAAGLAQAVGPVVLRQLGAAGHGPIFFYQLLRLDPQAAKIAAPMLAPLVRQLAVQSDQRLTWTAPGLGPSGRLDLTRLEDALLATPRKPFVGGIYGIMRSAEANKAPQRVVGPWTPIALATANAAEAGFAVVCRVAALAMIQEGPHEAKYGWSHCLTLPHGVWEMAGELPDPAFALRVAATYVASMRAAIGRRRRLSPQPDLAGSAPSLSEALERSPQLAAAAAWQANDTNRVFATLIPQAAIRSDAHLVKYVLACRDAAARDPLSAPAYCAGAAFLVALWMSEESPADIARKLGLAQT